MRESERLIKRILFNAVAACVVLPGVIMAGMAVSDHVRACRTTRDFAAMPLDRRIDVLQRAGYKRDWRMNGLVRSTLERSQDRNELQAAGYAAMRSADPQMLDLLTRCADRGPDDNTRAELIIYAARLANRDVRLLEWLKAGARSTEPWRRVGSAAGLLELGRLEAGRLVLAEIQSPANRDIASFGLAALNDLTARMAETIGQPVSWGDRIPPLTPETISELDTFWGRHATVTLLNDLIRRKNQRDLDWIELGRLIRARDTIGRMLQ